LSLGSLIRRHRKERGLTLKTVAERAGVSEGFMSQVENAVKSPSVETLMNICQAMDLEAGALLTQLSTQKRLFVFPKAEWDDVEISHTGFATHRLVPPERREQIDSSVLFLQPGQTLPVRKDVKGVQEVLCVLEGTLELRQASQTVIMNPGDSAHFWSISGDQSITNVGSGLAVALWVGTI
jgi:transcriptional regulator with XRE-family HTH domain